MKTLFSLLSRNGRLAIVVTNNERGLVPMIPIHMHETRTLYCRRNFATVDPGEPRSRREGERERERARGEIRLKIPLDNRVHASCWRSSFNVFLSFSLPLSKTFFDETQRSPL